MNKPVLGLLCLAFLFAAGDSFALGNRAKQSQGEEEGLREVVVSGKIRLVGSSPMTSLVITGEDREWHIEHEEKEKFMELQQQEITIRAKEYSYDHVFANGTSAGRYYYLKDIIIINTK
jgi:hypothetical protein